MEATHRAIHYLAHALLQGIDGRRDKRCGQWGEEGFGRKFGNRVGRAFGGGGIVFLFLLFQLFHEHAIALAVHDRAKTVFAQGLGDEGSIAVEFKDNNRLAERLCA